MNAHSQTHNVNSKLRRCYSSNLSCFFLITNNKIKTGTKRLRGNRMFSRDLGALRSFPVNKSMLFFNFRIFGFTGLLGIQWDHTKTDSYTQSTTCKETFFGLRSPEMDITVDRYIKCWWSAQSPLRARQPTNQISQLHSTLSEKNMFVLLLEPLCQQIIRQFCLVTATAYKGRIMDSKIPPQSTNPCLVVFCSSKSVD